MQYELDPSFFSEFTKTLSGKIPNVDVFEPFRASDGQSVGYFQVRRDFENLRIVADFYLFPNWNELPSEDPKNGAKSCILSFFRVSRLECNGWQEKFCKYFVFKCEGGGGTTLENRSVSEPATLSKLIN